MAGCGCTERFDAAQCSPVNVRVLELVNGSETVA